jgi:hypothetical protein
MVLAAAWRFSQKWLFLVIGSNSTPQNQSGVTGIFILGFRETQALGGSLRLSAYKKSALKNSVWGELKN